MQMLDAMDVENKMLGKVKDLPGDGELKIL